MDANAVMYLARYALVGVPALGAIVAAYYARERRSLHLGCLAGCTAGVALLAISMVVAVQVVEGRRMPQDPGHFRAGDLPDGVFVIPAVMGMLLISLSAVTYGVIWLRSERRQERTAS